MGNTISVLGGSSKMLLNGGVSSLTGIAHCHNQLHSTNFTHQLQRRVFRQCVSHLNIEASKSQFSSKRNKLFIQNGVSCNLKHTFTLLTIHTAHISLGSFLQ